MWGRAVRVQHGWVALLWRPLHGGSGATAIRHGRAPRIFGAEPPGTSRSTSSTGRPRASRARCPGRRRPYGACEHRSRRSGLKIGPERSEHPTCLSGSPLPNNRRNALVVNRRRCAPALGAQGRPFSVGALGGGGWRGGCSLALSAEGSCGTHEYLFLSSCCLPEFGLAPPCSSPGSLCQDIEQPATSRFSP